jgi:Spy/CpxP family protein refolding chaperone
MTRPKSVALAFLSGAVLVGGLLGFTADRVVFGDRMCEQKQDQGHLRDRLAADLGLDGTQRAAVDSLLDARDVRVRALYAPLRPKADSLYLETRDEIRQVLTAEQRHKFEDFIAKSNARRESR